MSAPAANVSSMSVLQESRTVTKEWPMWVGSSDDLRRLFQVMQKQYATLVPAHVEAELRHPREMLKFATERLLRLNAEKEEYGDSPSLAARFSENQADLKKKSEDLERTEAKASAAANITLTVIGLDGDRTTVKGSAEELIEWIDGKRFKSFSASTPTGDIRARAITVNVSREDGIDLRVSADDPAWCRAAFSELSDEIKKHVPGWKYVRHFAVLWLFYSALSCALWTFIGTLLPKGQIDWALGIAWILVIVTVGSFLLTRALSWSRRYVPAFDLVPSGAQPKGVSFMKFWGITVGASLVLGVAGNMISSAIL